MDLQIVREKITNVLQDYAEDVEELKKQGVFSQIDARKYNGPQNLDSQKWK